MDSILTRLGDLEKEYLIDDYAEGKDTGIIDLVLAGNIDPYHLNDLSRKTERYIEKKIRSLNSGMSSNLNWNPLKFQTGGIHVDILLGFAGFTQRAQRLRNGRSGFFHKLHCVRCGPLRSLRETIPGSWQTIKPLIMIYKWSARYWA